MWSKIFRIIIILIPALLLILLATQQDNLNDFISSQIKLQSNLGDTNIINSKIDSLYNYNTNGLDYQITFLEFGAMNCVACRKMVIVMEEVEKKYPDKVNVIFLNILIPDNQLLMKYYGVAVIPTQILLNSEGVEVYRHTGYISLNDIEKKF
jgi:thioredoxin